MFGYGDKFIHMIYVAYINIQSKTKINDLQSDPFPSLYEKFDRGTCSHLMMLIQGLMEYKYGTMKFC